MRFIQKVKSLFILFAVVFSASCTFLEHNTTASLTFSFDKIILNKIVAGGHAVLQQKICTLILS